MSSSNETSENRKLQNEDGKEYEKGEGVEDERLRIKTTNTRSKRRSRRKKQKKAEKKNNKKEE